MSGAGGSVEDIILLCRQVVQPVSEVGGDELAATSASQVLPPRNEVVLGPAFRHAGEITFSHVDVSQFNTSAPPPRRESKDKCRICVPLGKLGRSPSLNDQSLRNDLQNAFTQSAAECLEFGAGTWRDRDRLFVMAACSLGLRYMSYSRSDFAGRSTASVIVRGIAKFPWQEANVRCHTTVATRSDCVGVLRAHIAQRGCEPERAVLFRVAERGRFELPSRLRSLRFSRPVQSTALPPLRSGELDGSLSFYQAAATVLEPGATRCGKRS